MKQYWTLPEKCPKNLENHSFSFTSIQRSSREKLINRIQLSRSKIMCTEFANFYEKILNQGVFPQRTDFMKKSWELLKDHQLLFVPVEEGSRDSLQMPKEPWNFSKKLINFLSKFRKSYTLNFSIFSTKKSCNRGCFKDFSFYLFTTYVLS